MDLTNSVCINDVAEVNQLKTNKYDAATDFNVERRTVRMIYATEFKYMCTL